MGNLQKLIKRSGPGWVSVITGAGWQALEHSDKIGKVLPLPPWCLILVGTLWVIASKVARSPELPAERVKREEIVMIRERTTTVEREYVMRREERW